MIVYTLKELEPILKRKPKSIVRYIEAGLLSASIVNGRYLVSEEQVKKFLEDTTNKV